MHDALIAASITVAGCAPVVTWLVTRLGALTRGEAS